MEVARKSNWRKKKHNAVLVIRKTTLYNMPQSNVHWARVKQKKRREGLGKTAAELAESMNKRRKLNPSSSAYVGKKYLKWFSAGLPINFNLLKIYIVIY